MRNYPAKILLFGEHIVLYGAPALAVPVPYFSGQFEAADYDGTYPKPLRRRLMDWATSPHLRLIKEVRAGEFAKDLNSGMVFRSNIPMGYGLGSSGAICAAVYDHYCVDRTDDYSELKDIFSRMESYFHGKSSGIDPLTSYLNKPLIISNKTHVNLAPRVVWRGPRPIYFLLDSQVPRRAEQPIQWFAKQVRQPTFLAFLRSDYYPAHEALLNAWLSGDTASFWAAMSEISYLQFTAMRQIVPRSVAEAWQMGDSNGFYLKLCGAGGGGFMLGFARDASVIEHLIQNLKFPIAYADL